MGCPTPAAAMSFFLAAGSAFFGSFAFGAMSRVGALSVHRHSQAVWCETLILIRLAKWYIYHPFWYIYQILITVRYI